MADVSNWSYNITKTIYVQKWKVCKQVIEVTALLKNLRWEMKGVQAKVSIIGVRADGKIRPSRSQSLGKPRDARQWSTGRIFYLPLTTMIDPYNSTQIILPRVR